MMDFSQIWNAVISAAQVPGVPERKSGWAGQRTELLESNSQSEYESVLAVSRKEGCISKVQHVSHRQWPLYWWLIRFQLWSILEIISEEAQIVEGLNGISKKNMQWESVTTEEGLQECCCLSFGKRRLLEDSAQMTEITYPWCVGHGYQEILRKKEKKLSRQQRHWNKSLKKSNEILFVKGLCIEVKVTL